MTNVSRETQDKLNHYARLLQKWQGAINLVSNSTLDDIQNRHFADSQQLSPYIDQSRVVYDLGSGAGFPGLVLAMMRPDLDIHLIESDQRKCQFLRTVSRETDTHVQIHNSRIEKLNIEAPDIVTARALAPVRDILDYIHGWAETNPDLRAVLLKGVNAPGDIDNAKAVYDFTAEITPSRTGDGVLVDIYNIKT